MKRLGWAAVIALAAGCSEDASGGGEPKDGSAGSAGSAGAAGVAGSAGAGGSGGSSGSSGSAGAAATGGAADAAVDAALPGCPSFAQGVSAGDLESDDITEASGIVASRTQDGVLWVHNDSGDGPVLYAVRSDGKALGAFTLQGAQAADWEDIAIAGSTLYAGDIGDNPATRPEIRVYRVSEPSVDPNAPPVTSTLSGVDTVRLDYPNDQAFDAETLFADPVSGDLFVVTKAQSGTSRVFRAAAPLVVPGPTELELVHTLELGGATTGGDVSPDGSEIVIKTYGAARLWRRVPGSTIAEALMTEPCTIPLHSEPQGEAIGFTGDGSAYLTVSEGSHPPIWRFARQ